MVLRKKRKLVSRFFRRKNPDQGRANLQTVDKKVGNGAEASCITTPLCPEWRKQVIVEYCRLLERCTSPVERESLLPFSKGLIHQALYEELQDNLDALGPVCLEIAFLQLESFLPEDEYRVIQEFKFASNLIQEMSKSGDPVDIKASAAMVKQSLGERAIKIEERISEEIRRRMQQIHDLKTGCMECGIPCSC